MSAPPTTGHPAIEVEAIPARGERPRRVRVAVLEPVHGGRIYERDLTTDEARALVADLARAIEP